MEERFNTFTVLIANISRSISRIKSEEMAEYDLRGSHVSCLYYLYKQEGLTAKALGDVCHEDKASLSRAIKFLESSGFIHRDAGRPKRYQSPLALTARGRELGAAIADRIDRILERAAEGISEEQRAVMYDVLAHINRNLQTVCDGYAD